MLQIANLKIIYTDSTEAFSKLKVCWFEPSLAKTIFSRGVTLIPDEAEDMWHAYNLVCVGDTLRSTTIR